MSLSSLRGKFYQILSVESHSRYHFNLGIGFLNSGMISVLQQCAHSLLWLFVFPLMSGGILVLSFPRYDLGLLAWIGLVPLVMTLWGKGMWQGAFCGFLCSLVFFPGLFSWILEISGYTWVHHALLGLYFGSYFALFGAAFAFVTKRAHPVAAVFFAPALWVSLEYARSNLSFMALPWGLLAHSQYLNTRIVQIASITGAYGVSFLVVLLNSTIALLILALLHRVRHPATNNHPRHGFNSHSRAGGNPGKIESSPGFPSEACGNDSHLLGHCILAVHQKRHQPRISQPLAWPVMSVAILPATALFALAWLYGGRLISKPVTGEEIKVAVIQGNIEQARKWNPRHKDSIMQTYTDLSGSESGERPTLIVWPETATPDSITRDPKLLAQVKRLAEETGAHLVLGSSHNQKFMRNNSGQFNYLNSAFVISPHGETPLLQQYDKIRLLPFGEYLPLKGIIPWSIIGVHELSSYTPGGKVTIFEASPFRFGVTICWENIFPDVVRQFVKRGAQFIVNITNEAWFGRTAAPYQFVSMSVFRAVENQVYVVRCANTGVSCFIDPHGRISRRVSDGSGGDIFVRGSLTSSVVPLESRTIYTRYGDWFPPLCFLYCVVVLFCTFFRESTARRLSEDSLHV